MLDCLSQLKACLVLLNLNSNLPEVEFNSLKAVVSTQNGTDKSCCLECQLISSLERAQLTTC